MKITRQCLKCISTIYRQFINYLTIYITEHYHKLGNNSIYKTINIIMQNIEIN